MIVRGNMKPDTYKPTLSVQILPKSKEDQFVPGEKYSPRTGDSSTARTTTVTITILLPIVLLSAMSSLEWKLIQI